MSECFDLFLSFAQLEKKNEQAEKKTVTMVLLKLLFFFTGLLLLLLLSVHNFFSPCFYYKRNLKSIREMSGRRRGGGWASFPGFLLSPGGGSGAGFL